MRLLAFTSLLAVASALQSLPPVEFQAEEGAGFSVSDGSKNIYIDKKWASRKDESGLTTIPPSAYEFAEIFQSDLNELTGEKWTLERVDSIPTDGEGIYLGQFRGSAANLTYENGNATEEAYELEVGNGRIFIGGTGARGMWWGTRTLLQHLLLTGDDALPAGRLADSPAYETRGYLIDAGRKWYSPEFLKELCTFASFFKLSEFQYHLMDNYPMNRGRNATWNEVYHQFALMPEKNKELEGLIRMKNETLSRADYEDMEKHCASRGVTVIPEIEAPGHALAITKWKPELALPKKDLLNLTHPDSIPTVQSMWAEFLPWFHTKQVHVGADEYEPELADVYIHFVNEMNKFIKSESKNEKEIRIWGTHEPSETMVIDKDVIIQHWQKNQSDPTLLNRDGYRLINTEDVVVYTGMKNDHMPILPRKYPQWYNMSRTFHFGEVQNLQWDPTMFDPYNVTDVLPVGAPNNLGAIFAMWNDNGVDASTQLEAFHTMRHGFPVLGSRAWSGARGIKLDESTIWPSLDLLTNRAPGHNLDRRLPGEFSDNPPNPLYAWERKSSDSPDGKIELGAGGKGINYTLTLEYDGPFTLSSPDNDLSLDKEGGLVFTTDNWPYPLRHVGEEDGFDIGHPGRIWVNVSSSTHKAVTVPLKGTMKITTTFLEGSRVYINDEFVGRFEVFIFGGRNTQFSWSQMAFVAPLEGVEGGINKITVNALGEDGKGGDGGDGDDGEDDDGEDGDGTTPPPSNGAGSIKSSSAILGLTIACVFGHLFLA
ncbi:hypothetical protein FQN57_000786 [Myotisia sp. PD_48]|nr:hypothetical protein FQN57_000786 [Myotisia sp. PD_48]